MDLNLAGKSVLVMAASKGLGKATATEFAAEGAKVTIASRNEQDLRLTATEIKEKTGNAHVDFAVCDITQPDSIKQLVNKTASEHGTIDVLVNNAGGPPAGNFDAFDDDQWKNAFELILLSYIRTIREVLPYMRKQRRGRIVNVASSSIKQPLDNLILSNTFRTGIMGLSKSLALELGEEQILVNTVGPGRIATDRIKQLDQMRAAKLGIDNDELVRKTAQGIALGRYGRPDEFAKMVVFLCSEANTYITGQAFLVDGGLVKAL